MMIKTDDYAYQYGLRLILRGGRALLLGCCAYLLAHPVAYADVRVPLAVAVGLMMMLNLSRWIALYLLAALAALAVIAPVAADLVRLVS